MSEAVLPGPAVVPSAPKSRLVLQRVMMALFIALVAVALGGVAGPSSVDAGTYVFPSGTADSGSQAAKVLKLSKRQLGKHYKFGAEGMRRYDCSGLVYRMFKETGLIKKIGGYRMGATGYWRWFKRRGLANRRNPRPGDLIVWLRGGHIGIYIGKGMAVDATPSRGVGVRPVFKGWSADHLTAFLHVRISR